MFAKSITANKRTIAALVLGLAIFVFGWQHSSARSVTVSASSGSAPGTSIWGPLQQDDDSNQSTDIQNSNCVMCHQYEQFTGVTEDSLQVNLSVNEQAVNQSVHGQVGVNCVSCHTMIKGYPHTGVEQVTCTQCHEDRSPVVAELPYKNRREMTAAMNEGCRNCHSEIFSANSIHSAVAQTGLINPPLCTDCHGSHDVQHASDPPQRIGFTCGRCHTTVSTDFQNGKHYNGDPTTQTCVDCHEAHHLIDTGPTTAPTPAPIQSELAPQTSFLDQWNVTCTMCHQYPNLIGKAADSSTVSLTVAHKEYGDSVHAKEGLSCTACHESIIGYPHSETEQVSCNTCHGQADMNTEIVADLPFESTRALSIEVNASCRKCHEEQFKASADSIHTQSLNSGNLKSPLCVDCHGSHDIRQNPEQNAKSVELCASCHESVYTSYHSSIHGKAALDESNPDAPTCASCHDGHAVNGPGKQSFRSDSVAMCLGCHQNAEMMEKSGLVPDMFSQYVDNYHSTPVGLFKNPGKDDAAQMVVCYDCHGSHTVQEPDNPFSSVNSENITTTCQKCHPDATTRFANAGPAHSGKASQQVALVSWLNRIYAASTVIVFGSMIGYMVLDRRKRRKVRQLSSSSDLDAK